MSCVFAYLGTTTLVLRSLWDPNSFRSRAFTRSARWLHPGPDSHLRYRRRAKLTPSDRHRRSANNLNPDSFYHVPNVASARSKYASFLPSIEDKADHHCKCDRTKPCSACCARGHPKECQFIVGEGDDYSPIQQSYEIRKLRVENQRLKERLRAARLNASAEDSDGVPSPERVSSKSIARAAAARQRRFKTNDRSENLYFGTPGMANVVTDVRSSPVIAVTLTILMRSQFANLHVGNHSLTHTMPKARDIYQAETPTMYPFPILSFGDSASSLLTILPNKTELDRCLELYHHRAQAISFPHMPAQEAAKDEVERFLLDAERNAQGYPDMLALIFVMLANGLQLGVWDRCEGRWLEDEVRKITDQANVYGDNPSDLGAHVSADDAMSQLPRACRLSGSHPS